VTISPAAIDLMVGAGASCAQLAIVARQHFIEIADTIDALISADTQIAVIAALLKAQAADRGALAREVERRNANKAAQRKCRGRKHKKRAEIIQLNEPRLPLDEQPRSSMSDDSYDTPDSDDPPPLKEKSPPTPPSKENNPTPKIDDDDRARVISLISPDAKKLADEIGAIAGIDPDPVACPPGWCGTAMQVQSWLDGGWSADAIVAGTRTAMARRTRSRDGPPETPVYFTKEIARAVAQAAKPLPNAEILHERESGYSKDWRPGGLTRLSAGLGAQTSHPEPDFGT
jgi:hypothetical protein